MKRRSAFTLVELLVVISILVILSTLVWATFSNRSSEKMRSAARISQSAVLGAKDRALHAKDLRGIRLLRDPNSASATGELLLVNGLAYLQPLPMISYPGDPTTQPTGAFQLERLDMNQDGVPDSPNVVILRGFDSLPAPSPPAVTQPQTTVDWAAKSQFFVPTSRIRIPAQIGQWFQFSFATSGPYQLKQGNECLQLAVPFPSGGGSPGIVAFNCGSTFSSCDISLGNDLLPFHQPIMLPSSCVIDLKYSSQNVQSLAGIGSGTNPPIDIMFSPRGVVSGYVAGLGPLHFLMRDLRDATAGINPTIVAQSQQSRGDVLILSIFPQTGLVQVFEVDPTDANGDGVIDDLFAFAKAGRSAGH